MQKKSILCLSLSLLIPLVLLKGGVWAQPFNEIYDYYKIKYEDIDNQKSFFDDSKPLYPEFFKKVVSPEAYNNLTYDVAVMKSLWAEVVGFKAPDVVGKVAPEIKPGIYSYKDKNKFPFKELMCPELYTRFAPGGKPQVGNFPEIKVVPTRQYYYPLPIAALLCLVIRL